MKTLVESIFDNDLVTSKIASLYDLFGSHIKKFQHTYGGGLGWTHFYSQGGVQKEWKKEGKPELKGGFAKTTFPSDLQKFIAIILKNSYISEKELLKLTDGILDDESLNKELEEKGIIWPKGTMWGATDVGSRRIRVQISYIEGKPAGPGYSVSIKDVGVKRFKGFNTDKIEISIYAYDQKHPGFGSHIWTLLTDLTINDLKK